MIGGNITKGKQNNKYKYDNVANDAKIERTNMDVRRLILQQRTYHKNCLTLLHKKVFYKQR